MVAGFFVYQRIALELNKRGFQQARSAIDAVYANIVAKVGPPDNSKRFNSCNRSHQEFETGPLSCDVETRFIYGVSGLAEGDILFKKIQSSISANEKLLKPTRPLSKSIGGLLVVNTYYYSTNDYFVSPSRMDCIVSYTYNTPRQIDLQINDLTKKPLEISIDCSDWAKAQYYPLD